MSYGWIIALGALAIVIAIWLVGIYWADMKQWWTATQELHNWERTRVRADEREKARQEREARRTEG